MLRFRLEAIVNQLGNVSKYPISAVAFRRTLITPPSGQTILAFARFQHRANGRAGETSFSDPARPDLYYHRVEPPTPISASAPAFALSFLLAPPQSADASSVIGWLPAVHQPGNKIGLGAFKENPKFRDILHITVQEGLKEGVDGIQANSALQLQYGWLHIHDERNVPPLGRIGDPDDIIASVLVENGIIHAETYQPMPAYRLYTAHGVTKLTPGLAANLQNRLEKEHS